MNFGNLKHLAIAMLLLIIVIGGVLSYYKIYKPSYSPTTPSDIKLCSNKTTGEGLRYSIILNEGLSSVFYCWLRVPSTERGIAEEFVPCKPEDYWKISGKEKSYTDFISTYVKPKNVITVSLRSKEAFKFGVFELRTKLPIYANGPMLWFGFEADDLFAGGVVHFMWHTAQRKLYAFAGDIISRVEMDLTPIVGVSDFSTNYHVFKIVYREGLALWYVDGSLRAMAILASGDTRNSAILYYARPYAIGIVRDLPSAKLPILIDIDAGDISKDYEWDIHPWGLRVFEGDPKTSILLDLYIENTDMKWEGRILRQGSKIVSAPFPGTLDTVIIMFLSLGKGRLYIETYINGKWYTYKQIDVEGGVPYSYTIPDKNLLYRVVFEAQEDNVIIQQAKIYMK